MKRVEIICPACREDTLLTRNPLYEGFTKTGEELSCLSCGHIFENEGDVPFKEQTSAPAIFTDADRSEAAKVFEDDENGRLCRYCANYVLNPFMQYCSSHKKEVQATDTCDQFEKTVEEEVKL